jgi:hypothetical protein
MNEKKVTEIILSFLHEIGIPVLHREIETDCFLPGLSIQQGVIIIDNKKLEHPGDILHEAAHIAVVPAAERATLDAKEIAGRKDNAAEEMMAIAWSYAACVHLQIPPTVVFHEEGYQGGGKEIADNFAAGRYFGVPMLQWVGMTAEEKRAKEIRVNTYPYMLLWLRN